MLFGNPRNLFQCDATTLKHQTLRPETTPGHPSADMYDDAFFSFAATPQPTQKQQQQQVRRQSLLDPPIVSSTQIAPKIPVTLHQY